MSKSKKAYLVVVLGSRSLIMLGAVMATSHDEAAKKLGKKVEYVFSNIDGKPPVAKLAESKIVFLEELEIFDSGDQIPEGLFIRGA